MAADQAPKAEPRDHPDFSCPAIVASPDSHILSESERFKLLFIKHLVASAALAVASREAAKEAAASNRVCSTRDVSRSWGHGHGSMQHANNLKLYLEFPYFENPWYVPGISQVYDHVCHIHGIYQVYTWDMTIKSIFQVYTRYIPVLCFFK